MHRLAITYEVTIPQLTYIDIDEIIEAVIDDLKKNGRVINLPHLTYEFEDNVGYYLEHLKMMDDASLLNDSTVEEICEEFERRVVITHPEYVRTAIQ